MNPVLLLVDLQRDFLETPGLEPRPEPTVASLATLLAACRSRRVPVLHVQTTVDRGDDRRMPHWRRSGLWRCVRGAAGHQPPAQLRAAPGEPVLPKTFFSAFSNPELEPALRRLAADPLIVGGVHLHACVQATVLDAYQRGFSVWLASDGVASDRPLQAAANRQWLSGRAAWEAPVSQIVALLSPRPARPGGEPRDSAPLPAALIEGRQVPGDGHEHLPHHSPGRCSEILHLVPRAGSDLVHQAARSAAAVQPAWASASRAERRAALARLADLLQVHSTGLAELMAVEVGKPLRLGVAEVSRAVRLVRAAASQSAPEQRSREARVRRLPLGVVGAITPFNNPVAVPLGRIAAALTFGNTVVWKPSPQATGTALRLMELISQAGLPPGAVNLVSGGATTGETLMAEPLVDAIVLTGGPAAGRSAQALCGQRLIPLQAELGGNNAAIVWSGADLASAATSLAEAAFGYAGQRCTATRRVVVQAALQDEFVDRYLSAVARLPIGEAGDNDVLVGPLISRTACDRVASVVERASPAATFVQRPHGPRLDRLQQQLQDGAHLAPVVIGCPDPTQEVIQDETFGPVAVVQPAADLDEALSLCNGVRQALAAALFAPGRAVRQRFLAEARAGVLKLDQATADAGIISPFGGWGASGIGPPEHGRANLELYTRTQTIYLGSVATDEAPNDSISAGPPSTATAEIPPGS